MTERTSRWRVSLPPLRRLLPPRADDRRLPVLLELAREAWGLDGAGAPPGLAAAVAAQVQRDLRSLGLPGSATVEVRPVESTRSATGLDVHVAGRPCRSPDRVVLGGDAAPDARPQGRAATAAGVDDVAAAVSRVLQHQPAVLLGPGQVDAYGETLATRGVAGDALPDPRWLARVLRGVLDVGVSLADVEAVAEVVRDALDHDDRDDVVVERLVDRLQPAAVQVAMSPATLRATSVRMDCASTAFTELRTRMFRGAGIQFPDVELVADEALPADVFAFRLNALQGPATPLPSDGDPLPPLADHLGEALRYRWHWFGTASGLRTQLDQLGLVFPELVTVATRRYPVEWLSAFLRCMLREQVAVRNLGAVLDDLLDLDCDPDAGDMVRLSPGWTGPAESRPWTELAPPAVALAFVRQRVYERRWRSSPVEPAVELLDPRAEELAQRLVEDEGDPQAAADDADLVVVDAVGQSLVDTPWGPGVVTSGVPARSAVRSRIQAGLPDVRVLASVELPPGVGVRELPQHQGREPTGHRGPEPTR